MLTVLPLPGPPINKALLVREGCRLSKQCNNFPNTHSRQKNGRP